MKTTLAMSLLALATFADTPVVSDVDFVQDTAVNRNVTITYKLTGANAVVTIDALLDGQSIGEEYLSHFTGDVWKIVEPSDTETKTITWTVTKAWPDQKIDDARVSFKVSAWTLDNPPAYCVLDLVSGKRNYYTTTNALPNGGLSNIDYKTNKLVLRRIPANGETFLMGAPTTENGFSGSTIHREWRHYVSFTNDFYLGIYEFTQKQYELVFEKWEKDGLFVGDAKPVHLINYEQIRGAKSGHDWPTDGHTVSVGNRMLSKLRTLSGGMEFDLPTESQWEFACRAGTTTAFSSGLNDKNDTESILKFCWFGENANSGSVHEVGLLEPNPWGLYDMHGNVYELCLDWATTDPCEYEWQELIDPPGLVNSTGSRARRGGAWREGNNMVRSAWRAWIAYNNSDNMTGFRVACPAIAK